MTGTITHKRVLTPEEENSLVPIINRQEWNDTHIIEGVIGEQGPIGPQGEIGPPGIDGQNGTIGPQGIQGEPGLDGDIGPKGDTGDPGLKGDTGDQGTQGIQGIQGDTGLQGTIGPQGNPGIQGEQGLKGDKGDPGDPSELETVVVATADTPNATTTLSNATGLVCALLADSTYIIEGFIVWSTSVTTVGIKLTATGPTSPTLLAGHFITDSANGTPDSSCFNANDVVLTTSASSFLAGNIAALHCIVKTGVAGNFQIRFAAETTGTVTIKIGSTLRCRKVA